MMHSNLRWDDVAVLLACLEQGSLSAAAATLGVQQSTASRRLAAMEDALGAPLFTRTPEGVVPTQLASDLRGHAEAMRDHHEAMVRRVAGHEPVPHGCVRIACNAPLAVHGILPAIARLEAEFPDLRLELVVHDHNSDLVRGEADIALRFVRPTAGDLVGQRIAEFDLEVLGSTAYFEQFGPPTTTAGRWVNVALPFVETPEQVWYAEHIAVAPWLTTNNYLTAAAAIGNGQAVGLTTALMRKIYPNIQRVELGLPLPPPLEMWLVCHRAMRRVPRVDAVWSWLRTEFRTDSA